MCAFFFVRSSAGLAFGGAQGEKLLLLWTRDIGRGLNFRWKFSTRLPGAAVTKFNSVFMFVSSTMACLFRRTYLFDEKKKHPLTLFRSHYLLGWMEPGKANIAKHHIEHHIEHPTATLYIIRTRMANNLVPKTNRNKRKAALRTGTHSPTHRDIQSNKCVRLNCGQALSAAHSLHTLFYVIE